jgi:asparagine synthetase B (glutamine-hydrolysing)
MCGIYVSVSKTGPTYLNRELKQLLCQRGPDHLGEAKAEIETGNGSVSLSFTSTVLALRGGHLVAQPLVDPSTGSTLCWNGEAWKIGQELVRGNDGEAILGLLTSRTSSLSAFDSVTSVLEIIHSISGPFAFVYFDKVHNMLYFGRDYLGRRSLLLNVEDISATVQFSSIASKTIGSWREVEADGIYVRAMSNMPTHPSLASLPIGSPQSTIFTIYHNLRSLEVSEQMPVSAFLMSKDFSNIRGIDQLADLVEFFEQNELNSPSPIMLS